MAPKSYVLRGRTIYFDPDSKVLGDQIKMTREEIDQLTEIARVTTSTTDMMDKMLEAQAIPAIISFAMTGLVSFSQFMNACMETGNAEKIKQGMTMEEAMEAMKNEK